MSSAHYTPDALTPPKESASGIFFFPPADSDHSLNDLRCVLTGGNCSCRGAPHPRCRGAHPSWLAKPLCGWAVT